MLNSCCIHPIENPKFTIPKSRLRIALCMEYPLKQWGGVEVLVKELLAGLSPGTDILLASDDTPESLSESRHAEFVTSHFRWDPSRSYPAQARDLSAWLLGSGADLVHFHLGGTYAFQTRSWAQSPIPIVATSGIPCISTNHGAFSLFDFCGPQRSLAERLLMLPIFWAGRAKTLLALRREVTVSDNDLGNMRRWFFPLVRKFQRIYHSQLSGDEGFYAEREKSIVCLGTVGPRKGQPFLVEAFASLAARFPDWKLVIAGRLNSGADEVRKMESIISRENLHARIVLAGPVTPEEANRLILTCGIFAMPSLAEGLGLSLQEALFSGCPAVASRVGGIQDMVVDGKTGWLAEAGNPTDLARALAEAMESESVRKARGAAARERIIALGMNRHEMVSEHLRLYAEITNR